MAVKIRLQRKGRKQAPFYHIVIADARSPRDGKYIERIGSYNPMTKPATIDIDRDAAFDWLGKGAQPTDTVRAILRFKGVYVKRHLMRGVAKGALTIEQANEKWAQWVESKEAHIQQRTDKTKEEKAAYHKAVHGEAKPKAAAVKEDTTADEILPASDELANVDQEISQEASASNEVVETDVPVAAEDPGAVAAESAVEELPAAEEPAQESSEETPAEEK